MDKLPGGAMPPSLSDKFSWKPEEVITSQLTLGARATEAESGFLSHINARRMESAKQLSVYSKSALKTDVIDLVPKKIGASSDPPFGRGK